MTRKPAVSFLIPAHNRPELLKAALASCIAQSCDAWEAVVVDDHSETADLQSLVASFDDARLRYARMEVGEHGVSMARNRAIDWPAVIACSPSTVMISTTPTEPRAALSCWIQPKRN